MSTIRIVTYVLDDDWEELKQLQVFLNNLRGCNVQLFRTIDTFVAAIEQGCHIAIIDYQLGAGIDGIDVGRMVLDRNPLCFLVMLSSREDKQTLVRAINTGFRYYVDKRDPGYRTQVAAVVERQMEQIQMRCAIYEKYKNRLEGRL